MNIPKIAAILPVYNGEKFLNEALKSVFEQNMDDWFLYIINDGSTDRTSEILWKWKTNYPDKINLMTNETNKGYAFSCNIGLENSRLHPYILTINADDIQHKNRFSTLLKQIESSNLDFVVHDCEIIDKEGKSTGRRKGFDKKINQRNVLAEQMKRNHFWNGLVLFRNRHDLLVDSKLRVSEDYDLFLRLLYTGATFKYLDVPLLRYRIHDTNISLNHNLAEEVFKVIFDKYDITELEKKIIGSYDLECENYIALTQVCIYRKMWNEGLVYIEKGMSCLEFAPEIMLELLFMQGYIYFCSHQYSLAEKSYERALKLNNSNPAILNNLGAIKYLLNHSNRDSKLLFIRALEIEPLYSDARNNLDVVQNEISKTIRFTPRLLRNNIIRGL